MSITELRRDTIIHALFSNQDALINPLESHAKRDPNTLDQIFKIDGLMNTVLQTYHLAEWRVLALGRREGPRNFSRELGLDLSIGPKIQELRLRYFPNLQPNNKFRFTTRLSALYFRNGDQEIIVNSHQKIRNCSFANGLILFEFKKSDVGPKLIKRLSILPRTREYQIVYIDQPPKQEKVKELQPELFKR